MAVVGDFRVDVRPYSAYEDPSLPIAAWIAQAGIAGDASGGDLFIRFVFAQGDDNQQSELFNLEQIAGDTDSLSTEELFLMDVINFDELARNRQVTDRRYAWRMVDTIAGEGVALRNEGPRLPIWLGVVGRQEGDSVITFQFDNVNLRLYQIVIQGYMWGPRSVLAPGGPRRPVGGLFGTG